MTEGLLHSYTGQLWLLGVWAFLGIVGASALTFVVMVRKGAPLTTQTNRVTGVREHGVLRWWCVLSAVFAGPPVVLGVGVVGTHLVYVAASWVGENLWFLGVAGVVAVIGVGAWVLVVGDRRSARRDREAIAALPASVPPPPAPGPSGPPAPVGWSLPDGVGQWDERQR